jgi:hypothetical protein
LNWNFGNLGTFAWHPSLGQSGTLLWVKNVLSFGRVIMK